MSDSPLTIALLGGIPASLGGGGLELQRDRTAQALRGRGHDVFQVALETVPRPFDLLHAFGGEVDVCHQLHHWRRNLAPLVVSPVIVASPGLEERLLRAAARIPLLSLGPRMRAETFRRADLLIALTEHESRLLRALAPGVPSTVIGNGVAIDGDMILPDRDVLNLRSPYALLLGTVSERKRQRITVQALAATPLQPVIVGAFAGGRIARAEFERAVAAAGGRWLGEVNDPAAVRGLVHDAAALIHLSAAEGQSLAVLEALAEATPVVCTPLPANRELARLFPRHVHLCAGPEQLPDAIARLPADLGDSPQLPTWEDVAEKLEGQYRSVLRSRA